MITTRHAQEIVKNSIQRLASRKGTITNEEYQAETINLCCKYILEVYKDTLNQVHDVHRVNTVFQHNFLLVHEDVERFVDAATEIFPMEVSVPNPYNGASWRDSIISIIISNICWAGMWNFLVGYFQQHHGVNINSGRTGGSSIFYSRRHIRYEHSNVVSESEIERNINVLFLDNERTSMIISIEPALSAKTANLVSQIGNKWEYQGTDPDYLFILYLDRFDEVERFVLEMPNRGLRIEYY